MKRVLGHLWKRALDRLDRASWVTLAVAGVVLVIAVGAGIRATYRTYDYVQHDNDFCTSCHLMADPFERFGESVHQELSCKACHQPRTVDRALMGIRQIVVNPEEIEEHAEVPDSRCEHCHVEGDPEIWILINNSRGHEIHLNSVDPVLQNLHCVDCHSSTVHDFATTEEGCARRGCHDESDLHLGAMGQMEISCEACHDFRAPLGDPEDGSQDPASLRPTSEQCLSCHEMRDQVDIDLDGEPHGGECGACHNPHTQRSAADPVNSCVDSLCHGVPGSVEDNHHQWESVRLEDCVQCHEAHTFRVDGDDCGACHADVGGGVPGA